MAAVAVKASERIIADANRFVNTLDTYVLCEAQEKKAVTGVTARASERIIDCPPLEIK